MSPRHLLALAFTLLVPFGASAQTQAAPLKPLDPIPAAASGASGKFDVDAATRAYLDQLPADKKARSNAYFEGGYWIDLWSFLWNSAIFLFLLQSGLSVRLREWAARRASSPTLQTLMYWPGFLVAITLLSLPLDWYVGWYREQQYGMSNQTMGAWIGEWAKEFAIWLILGGIALITFYAIARRLQRSWWVWGAISMLCFLVLGAAIAPVYIVPLFNTPKRLEDQRVVQPILSLARANGVDANEVWEIDASKQTKRASANVSGMFGSERITLNDNLLNRSSLPEIEAVMGHEMGHYVLNHVYKGIVMFGVIIVIGFAFLARFFDRWRGRWGVTGVGDVAGLPLLCLLFGVYLFVMTPVLNTIVRTQEYEADIFGLNAARQPDGFARAALLLSEYRKMEPGPIEEILFYDHPSGRTRIHSAMRWKAEHPETWSTARDSTAK